MINKWFFSNQSIAGTQPPENCALDSSDHDSMPYPIFSHVSLSPSSSLFVPFSLSPAVSPSLSPIASFPPVTCYPSRVTVFFLAPFAKISLFKHTITSMYRIGVWHTCEWIAWGDHMKSSKTGCGDLFLGFFCCFFVFASIFWILLSSGLAWYSLSTTLQATVIQPVDTRVKKRYILPVLTGWIWLLELLL